MCVCEILLHSKETLLHVFFLLSRDTLQSEEKYLHLTLLLSKELLCTLCSKETFSDIIFLLSEEC